MNFLRVSFLTLVFAGMLAGCAKTITYSPATAPEYMVISDYTPFYRLGPEQVQGPDSTLKARTYVKVLRREMGYSYVQLEDGMTGYVPNDNIMVAPALPRPAAVAAGPSYSGTRKHSGYSGPANGQPNFVPLPEPSMPPAQLDVAPEVMPSATPTPVSGPADQPKYRY